MRAVPLTGSALQRCTRTIRSTRTRGSSTGQRAARPTRRARRDVAGRERVRAGRARDPHQLRERPQYLLARRPAETAGVIPSSLLRRGAPPLRSSRSERAGRASRSIAGRSSAAGGGGGGGGRGALPADLRTRLEHTVEPAAVLPWAGAAAATAVRLRLLVPFFLPAESPDACSSSPRTCPGARAPSARVGGSRCGSRPSSPSAIASEMISDIDMDAAVSAWLLHHQNGYRRKAWVLLEETDETAYGGLAVPRKTKFGRPVRGAPPAYENPPSDEVFAQ